MNESKSLLNIEKYQEDFKQFVVRLLCLLLNPEKGFLVGMYRNTQAICLNGVFHIYQESKNTIAQEYK